MNKHTPGPWRIGKHPSEVIADMPATPPFDGMTDESVKHYGGYLIAESCGYANARLVAAAPELLAALQDCVTVMEKDLAGLRVIQPELNQARAALAAARGDL